MKMTKQLNTMVTPSELIMKEFNLAMLASECKSKSRNNINDIVLSERTRMHWISIRYFCASVRLSHISNNLYIVFFLWHCFFDLCWFVISCSLLFFCARYFSHLSAHNPRKCSKQNANQNQTNWDLHIILPRTFSMRSSFNTSNTSSPFSQFKCMSFDMALLLSAVCALLLSTSSLVASAFTFSLDNLFALVVLKMVVVVMVVVFETGCATLDAAVVGVVVVDADAVAVRVVVAAAAVAFVVLAFGVDSGFGTVASLLLLFLREFLLRSSLSVICNTTSSPHCLSLIGFFSHSIPRNRRAMS